VRLGKLAFGPLALVALATVALFIAWDYGLWTFGAPGAGLMPTLAATLLAVTSLLALVERQKPVADDDGEPDPRRLSYYLVGLVALVPAILAVGMLPALGVFILLCLRLAERMSWKYCFAIAICAIAGSWLLFERLLQVRLPRGWIG
jgi:hypothetical protein